MFDGPGHNYLLKANDEAEKPELAFSMVTGSTGSLEPNYGVCSKPETLCSAAADDDCRI